MFLVSILSSLVEITHSSLKKSQSRISQKPTTKPQRRWLIYFPLIFCLCKWYDIFNDTNTTCLQKGRTFKEFSNLTWCNALETVNLARSIKTRLFILNIWKTDNFMKRERKTNQPPSLCVFISTLQIVEL